MISRFFMRLGCFIFPFCVLILVVFGMSYHIGELMTYHTVIDLQMADHSLVYSPTGFGVENIAQYKLEGAGVKQPELVVVGSSRVLSLRQEMFTGQPHVFYNAAVLAALPETVALLVENLPTDPAPRLMIVGIDPHFFNINPEYVPLERLPSPENFNPITVVRQVLRRLARVHIPLDRVLTRSDQYYGLPALGIHAVHTAQGFRGDGSYRWVTSIETSELNITLASLPEASTVLHTPRLDAVERILAWAAKNGVTVIGIVPPYEERYYDLIQNSPDHSFYRQAREQIRTLFDEYGFSYYDLADLASADFNNSEMHDLFHMTDLLTARVILGIARREPSLGAYVDIEQLERDIAQAPSPDTIYDRLPIITPLEADQP